MLKQHLRLFSALIESTVTLVLEKLTLVEEQN